MKIIIEKLNSKYSIDTTMDWLPEIPPAPTFNYDTVFFSNSSAANTNPSPNQQPNEESTKLAK